jgi:hypothetical protein
MRNTDRLTVPAYVLAASLLLVPFLDLLVQVWPMLPSQSAWRFGTLGLLSRTLITPSLGLLLLLGAALSAEHAQLLRVISALSGVISLVLFGCLALFLIDGIEVRALVAEDGKDRFDLTALVASAKLGMGFVVTFAYCVFGWRASRALTRQVDAAHAVRGPGIVASGAHRAKPEPAAERTSVD